MKIIEALKQIKDLSRKCDDLQKKVSEYCADTHDQAPVYTDQAGQVAAWIQSHSDILKEIMRLRIAVSKTNLVTQATIELGGNNVSKSLAEWILRRGTHKKEEGLAFRERAVWQSLSDKGLRPKAVPNMKDPSQPTIHMVRRYFDPSKKDKMVDDLTSEPVLIDAALEIKNAVTDLLEEIAA